MARGPKNAGDKRKTIGINMTEEMAKTLEERANSMHLSTSKYCKIIFSEWLASGKALQLSEK